MHLEALTDDSRRLLPALAEFADFYLAGGTGLALQLGHRISVDFDFFTAAPLPRSFLGCVERVLSKRMALSPMVNNADELTLTVGATKLSFVYYPFPLLQPLIDWQGLRLASVHEIAAMKAYAIGRRGTFKDYADLYAVLRSGLTLPAIIELAEQRYGAAFNARLFLEQLVYVEDVTDTALQFSGAPLTLAEVASALEAEVKKLKI